MEEIRQLTLTVLIIALGILGTITMARSAFERQAITVIVEYQECLDQTQYDQEYCVDATR